MGKRLKDLIIRTVLFCSLLTLLGKSSMIGKAESLNLDDKYRQAYSYIVQAMEDKSQISINRAREALEQLKLTDASWAIGEFSKQLDIVQQPILSKAYEGIETVALNPTQENINIARNALDINMPAFYLGSYSSAIDILQQSLVEKTNEALIDAVANKTDEDAKKAADLVADLKTSTNEDVKFWLETTLSYHATNVWQDFYYGRLVDGNIRLKGLKGTQLILRHGEYGAAFSGPNSIDGNVVVDIRNSSNTNANLYNIIIVGKLIINTEESYYGKSIVSLNNVIADEVIVKNIGGGLLNITGNSNIKKLLVEDKDDNCRIVIDGKAKVVQTIVYSNTKLEILPTAESSNPFGEIVVNKTEPVN